MPQATPGHVGLASNAAAPAGGKQPVRKGNTMTRYLPDSREAIWSDELHAVLLEALRVHPPMGKQRIRYPYGPGEGATERTPSLGRCQLIQHYMKEKTGKVRTRKQIASRLQRLRRIHKNDPKMMELLQVIRDPVVKSGEFVDFGDDREPTPTQELFQLNLRYNPPASLIPASFSMDSLDLPVIASGHVHKEEQVSAQPKQEYVDVVLSGPSAAQNIDRMQAAGRGGDGTSAVVRSSSWEAPSMSRRRLLSNMPALHRQVPLPPVASTFHPIQSHYGSYGVSSLSQTSTDYFPARLMAFDACEDRKPNPITPVEQILHTPDEPPELARPVARKQAPTFVQKHDRSLLAVDQNISPLAQYDLHSSSLMSPVAFGPGSVHANTFQASASQSYYSLPPSPRAVANQDASHYPSAPGTFWHDHSQHGQAPSGSRTMALRLPRRLSYSNESSGTSSAPSSIFPSPRVPASAQFLEDNVSHAFGNLELASPVSIRPYLMSELSFSSNDGLSSVPEGLDEMAGGCMRRSGSLSG